MRYQHGTLRSSGNENRGAAPVATPATKFTQSARNVKVIDTDNLG